VFAAKSAPPSQGSIVIHRPVFERAAEHGLTLFESPAGYLLVDGLSAILAERAWPFLWLRLGVEDRDPAILLTSIISAAQRLNPGVGSATLKAMQQNPGPVAGWPALFVHLASELADGLPQNCAIVLEQIHNLNSSPAAIGLLTIYLLANLPDSLPLILCANDPIPSSTFPSKTVKNGVKELRVDIRQVQTLAENTRVRLPRDTLRRAVSLTEGRGAVLASLLVACRSLGPVYFQETVNRSRDANQLLSLIARDSLTMADSNGLQALNLAMHLGYGHPDLMQASLGNQASLDGPWVQSLADGWKRLRYLWLDPLRSNLRAEIEAANLPIRRAADYLFNQGAVVQAIQLYLEIEDYDRAVPAIAGISDRMMDLGQWETLNHWLKLFPAGTVQDWPWLVYLQGELATLGGELNQARKVFANAAALFSERRDYEGACQSLLAKSSLAAWQDEDESAQASALQASALAEASGLNWYQGWAAWQLGSLALRRDDLSNALIHFSNAALKVEDPLLNKLFQKAESLVLSQRNLRLQSEFHRKEHLQAEQMAEETGERLQTLISSQTTNLAALLGTRGWSDVPLEMKLSALVSITNSTEDQTTGQLWQRITSRFSWPRRSSRASPGLPRLALPLPGLSSVQPGWHPSDPDEPGWSPDPSNVLPVQLALQDKPGQKASRPGSGHRTQGTGEREIEVKEKLPGSQFESQMPAPQITAYLLGSFRVAVDYKPVKNWSGSRGQGLLKYFLINKSHKVSRDVLMDVFWPEAGPEAARNNLNVALHALRRVFRTVTSIPVVLYDNEKKTYQLNPDFQVWLDVDEFNRHLQAARQLELKGQHTQAVREYEVAASLYQGDFLAENMYEEWTTLDRERLRIAYLDLLDRLSQVLFSQAQYTACVTLCQQILERDNCREDAYRRLMRCHSRLGQPHLALRQYQACVETLRIELDVSPEQATLQLYQRIRQHERI